MLVLVDSENNPRGSEPIVHKVGFDFPRMVSRSGMSFSSIREEGKRDLWRPRVF